MKKTQKTCFHLFILITSFFLFNNSADATLQKTMDNLTYVNHLNFYNLQFSDNPIAKKYWTFFEDIDFDLHTYLLLNDSYIKNLDPPKNWLITFSGFYNSDGNNNYNFYSDLLDYRNCSESEECYTMQFTYRWNRSNDVLFEFLYKNKNISLPDFNYPNFSSRNFLLEYYPSLNSFKLKVGNFQSTNFNNNLGDAFSQLSGAFYQSNFFMTHTPSYPADIVEIIGIKKYPDLENILSKENTNFLGSDYFKENLIFGGGSPLYPFYTYITGKKEFGVPYTNDFSKFYIYDLDNCIFTPKDKLFEDFDNIKSQGLDKFYIEPLYPKFYHNEDSVHLFVYDDLDKLQSGAVLSDKEIDNSPHRKYEKIPVSKNLRTFRAPVDNRSDFLYLFKESPGTVNSTNAVVVHYPKDYWEGKCSYLGNDVRYTDEHGNEINVTPPLLEDNRDKPWWQSIGGAIVSIVDFFIDSFQFIAQLRSKLTTGFKNLGSNIAKSFTAIGDLLTPISVIGHNVTLLFNSLPAIVTNTFYAIFTISILGIILKLIL